jgi:hypothetical protein
MDYAALKVGVVAPTITRYGTPITYHAYTDDYDPDTGENERTEVETAAHGIVAGYKARAIDGAAVKAGDRRIISADIPAPTVGDQVEVVGTTYTVVGWESAEPAGMSVVYVLQVRP